MTYEIDLVMNYFKEYIHLKDFYSYYLANMFSGRILEFKEQPTDANNLYKLYVGLCSQELTLEIIHNKLINKELILKERGVKTLIGIKSNTMFNDYHTKEKRKRILNAFEQGLVYFKDNEYSPYKPEQVTNYFNNFKSKSSFELFNKMLQNKEILFNFKNLPFIPKN